VIHPRLTVRALRCRAVHVPMKRPLGTSAARMATAPFLLLDLDTEEGITGRAHAFCYLELAAPAMSRVLAVAGELIAGAVLDPAEVERRCRTRFALLGTQGVVGMALAALDVACWDALSRAANLPLARFLDGTTTSVAAYNSNGLSLTEPDGLADEALALLDEGFSAVKIRLGRPDAAADLRAVRAVRAAMPAACVLMADYNQALSVDEAIRRGAALQNEGLYWIEEPVAHDDLAGSARVAAALATPIQSGENFCGTHAMATALALRATDYVMPDLMRIGGVSGWLRAARLAQAASMPMSSHLYPEVSAHLLAATPTAHWLEYVDWAEPFLAEGVTIRDGRAVVPDTPGTGVTWDEAAVRRYAVE
jgi:mandelate racemase